MKEGNPLTFLASCPFPPEKPFTVEIGPGPHVAAQLGSAVVLTCSATDCEAPSFSWRTQTDSPLSGQVRSKGPRSTLTLSPVDFENEQLYLCTVTCGRKKLEKGIKVDLYCEYLLERFPVLFSVLLVGT